MTSVLQIRQLSDHRYWLMLWSAILHLMESLANAEQDILIHCLSLAERGQKIDNGASHHGCLGPCGPGRWWRWRGTEGESKRQLIGVVVMAGGTLRRRSRQAVSRSRVVQFSLTEEEFDQLSRAAERSGLARGRLRC
jgi:hypothetical protein